MQYLDSPKFHIEIHDDSISYRKYTTVNVDLGVVFYCFGYVTTVNVVLIVA